MNTLGIPKGTRDFSPVEVVKRNYIMNAIKACFSVFGFQPIETPSFENSDTLMGKYGEEGDRLIFKILNSGDYLNSKKNTINDQIYDSRDSSVLTKYISEKALRYDLTVPFARYVVQHQNEFSFPFKRYQIQPVWRADRPQKGRFREFFQCDADVVGSVSLWQEVEFLQLYDAVFSKLKLQGVTIKMNNRKILAGIAQVIGQEDKLIDFTVALDKLDKIGAEKVKLEMLSKGIQQEALTKVQPLFETKGTNWDKLEMLRQLLASSEIGMKGVEELTFILKTVEQLGLKSSLLEIEVTLARGLNYYTGAIFEVAAPKGIKIGSIGGGGRYDNLTGIFGLKGVSGVGISFGLDRIYLVLEELALFPKTVSTSTKILFLNFGEQEALYAMRAVAILRNQGVVAELYPDATKMKKQMNYANKREIPFVVLAGTKEMQETTFTLKNMIEGAQEVVSLDKLLQIMLALD